MKGRSNSEPSFNNVNSQKANPKIKKYLVEIFDGRKEDSTLLINQANINRTMLKDEYECLLKHREISKLYLNKVMQ